MPAMTRRRTLVLLTLLTLLAFSLRVLSLDAQSMWRDEIDTLCFALDFWDTLKHSVAHAQTGPIAPSDEHPYCQPTPGLSRADPANGPLPTLRALLTLPGWNGPLYTLAMRPWIGLSGYSSFALRYSSLLFGLLAVPLTYALGRRLLGAAVGLWGATLITLSPHLVWYSQEAKMYGAILALSLLALYGLRRAVDSADGGARWWALTVGATTLALYTHILTALLIPLLVALALIWWPRTRRHRKAALVTLACLTWPYLPLLAWQARNWLLPARRATLFTVGRLDAMLESTFNGWGSQFIGEPWATLVLAGLGGLALCGLAWVWLTDDTSRWRAPLTLLTWALLPFLGIWLISTRQPIFTNRYLIWAAPAFYLLSAAGATALARRGRGWMLVAGGLLALVFVGDGRALQYQATRPLKPDFRAAAAYLEERYQPGDLIIFHLSYVQSNFDYYYTGDYHGWGAPAPAGGMPGGDLDSAMHTNTSGYRVVWLVLSEPAMWDPQGLVKAWLDEHALAPPGEQAFVHVSVYRYELDW